MKRSWWDNFTDCESAENVEMKRKKLIFYFSCYIGSFIIFVFASRHNGTDDPQLKTLLYSGGFVLFFTAALSHFINHFMAFATIAGLCVATFMLLLLMSGGFENTGLYWLYPFPIVLYVLFGHRYGILLNLLLFATFCFLLYNPSYIKADYRPEEISRFLSSFLVMATLMFITEFFRFRSHEEMTKITNDKQKLANTDPLTRLPNRRYLDSVFYENATSRPDHYFPLTIIVADLDHFKRINDTFGHDVGDQVLVETAQRFSLFIRKVDVVIRTGGEEFMILLPNTEESQGLLVASKLCDHIADNSYEVDDMEIDITCSFGLSCTQSITRFDETVKAADALLYKAKAAGRNQVIVD